MDVSIVQLLKRPPPSAKPWFCPTDQNEPPFSAEITRTSGYLPTKWRIERNSYH
jgi:hypothetical protein